MKANQMKPANRRNGMRRKKTNWVVCQCERPGLWYIRSWEILQTYQTPREKQWSTPSDRDGEERRNAGACK